MERKVVLTLLGTRPEVIKLAPVLRALDAAPSHFESVPVLTGQHTDLVESLIPLFDLQVRHDLKLMKPGQSPLQVTHRVLEALDPVLERVQPDAVLVQGDTVSAMAGAMAAFYRGIPVGHVEAGLRTDHPRNPFPEEMNRRLITRLASYHFAATEQNRQNLLAEDVPADRIECTGNPVVDSLKWVLARSEASPAIEKLLAQAETHRLIVLTTHRRESFGEVMEGNLRVLRDYVESHPDAMLAFPVHPNPAVREVTERTLAGSDRIHLLDPLGYEDFTQLLAHAWLIVSDSGGIQEEAPSLGKPLLILRENTERPEAVTAGVARLVGSDEAVLARMLDEVSAADSWATKVREVPNPFGDGHSGDRIVAALQRWLAAESNPQSL